MSEKAPIVCTPAQTHHQCLCFSHTQSMESGKGSGGGVHSTQCYYPRLDINIMYSVSTNSFSQKLFKDNSEKSLVSCTLTIGILETSKPVLLQKVKTPMNAAFHQGLHCLLRLKETSVTKMYHNGQSYTYCISMHGKIHQNTKR